MIIGTVIAVSIVVAGVFLYLKNIKDNNKEKDIARVEPYPNISADEVTVMVNTQFIFKQEEISGRSYPRVYMIRDVDAFIEPLGASWRAYTMKEESMPSGAYHKPLKTIFVIRQDNDIQHFGKLYVHELLHAAGYEHGIATTKLEMSLHNKLFSVMGWE